MDHATKRNKIENIASEVNELHPLLESIFHSFPRINYVEYTHGPHEKGADFVIERLDQDIGTINYIGVVAKTDKILTSFADVERQIDECGHARLIRNGSQSVRLPEVWVVTSKSVSQNAKEKIQEKFAAKKIHFFDADWLVKQVDLHASHFWEEVDGATGRYLANLDKRLGVISAQTSIVTTPEAGSVSMELDVEELDSDRYGNKKRQTRSRIVNIREEAMSNKISIVEAEMGSGKSHLVRRVALHFADLRNHKETGVLPVYATFKAYLDSKLSLSQFLIQATGQDCFESIVKNGGKLLLILDGVDEALANQEKCREKVKELLEAVKVEANLSLLLTSRPWKALDEVISEHNSARKYRIRPLSVGKIIAYLRQVLDKMQLPNKLVDDLANSSLFKQLPQNPIAASLLANIVKQEKYELPSTLTELYSKTVENMLGRWDERRQIATEKQYKGNERLARLLAKHMIDNQLVYMSKNEIRQMFSEFLADRQTGISLDETFDYLINRSTLFGVFEDTDAIFFKHRSFAEYLYAKDAEATRSLSIDSRAFEVYWANTYFFYVGLRSECPDLIDDLVAIEVTEIQKKVFRMLNMGNYMLAGWETPYDHIQRALDTVLLEAANLYLDIRYGRIKTGLTGLTEMQLLWYFTQAVRSRYGYDFFSKALPLTIAKLDESLAADDEARHYALFFAACSLAEVGDTCGFSYLLNNSTPTTLPIQISFALKCEMSYGSKEFAHSKPVKDFDKKLSKILRIKTGEKLSHDARLKALFHEPLNTRNAKISTSSQLVQQKSKVRN